MKNKIPVRGRKQALVEPRCLDKFVKLKNKIPVRGRKRLEIVRRLDKLVKRVEKQNPRKGTETRRPTRSKYSGSVTRLKNKIPVRGRKLYPLWYSAFL